MKLRQKNRTLLHDVLLSPLGREIRIMRRKRELNIEQLANRSEIGVGYLSQIETGKRNTSLAMLWFIATALRCRLSIQFIPLEEDPEQL